MVLKHLKNTVLFIKLFTLLSISISCKNGVSQQQITKTTPLQKQPITGANQTEKYINILQGKRIGIVANQTSVIFKNNTKNYTHIVDSLLSKHINITKVFSPEHGFRGTADAGEAIKNGIDIKTKLPIISLYGNNKKPTASQLQNIDLMVFDIQDVGARFYTYISTLHYVMEACAELNIPVLILDRPNPNGHYIDGPILEKTHKSFVGMHPIPVVHGMTIGEYAKMINGENWLKNQIKAALTVIPVLHYNKKNSYKLPIKPSPNLPNDKSINLYPSLCFFEGTIISVGRGTNKQFQVIGAPNINLKTATYTFTPHPNLGAKHPKHNQKTCYGLDLSQHKTLNNINLKWLISFYNNYKTSKQQKPFFNAFFTKLAGTKKLQEQIENGLTDVEIKKSWKQGLDAYKKTRKPYLIYK